MEVTEKSEMGDEALLERGGRVGDTQVTLNRRLFFQLHVFGGCTDVDATISVFRESGIPSVVYEDLNDPTGIGILAFFEDPELFLEKLRPALVSPVIADLHQKHELTMSGRTYAVGYEKDLEYALIDRPKERLENDRLSWAIWYPLKRRSTYERLPGDKQREIQMEHRKIARRFTADGTVGDIRLASFGLNTTDNDFIVALLGETLHPLSAVVQQMRKSVHTAEYIESMGPFFVGRVRWRGIDPNSGPVTGAR